MTTQTYIKHWFARMTRTAAVLGITFLAFTGVAQAQIPVVPPVPTSGYLYMLTEDDLEAEAMRAYFTAQKVCEEARVQLNHMPRIFDLNSFATFSSEKIAYDFYRTKAYKLGAEAWVIAQVLEARFPTPAANKPPAVPVNSAIYKSTHAYFKERAKEIFFGIKGPGNIYMGISYKNKGLIPTYMATLLTIRNPSPTPPPGVTVNGRVDGIPDAYWNTTDAMTMDAAQIWNRSSNSSRQHDKIWQANALNHKSMVDEFCPKFGVPHP